MKKSVLFIITGLFLACNALAQAPGDIIWTRTFGGSGIERAFSVKQTADGGFIISGFTESYGAGNEDAWVVKTDENGIEEWNQTYGGLYWEDAFEVQQTTDGGYIMTGFTNSFSSIPGGNDKDFWLIKTDENGIEEWNQTYGGSDGEWAYSVQQTADGGFIIGGVTESYGAGGFVDYWLVKTDENGVEEWNQTYGGIGTDIGVSVQQTTDGGYIFIGHTDSYGTGGLDCWLIKTDVNGNEEWNQTYGGINDEYGYSVRQTTDGGYIFTGCTGSYGGTYELWLVKTDENGTEEWNQTYGGTDWEFGNCIQLTTEGGFIIAGYTESYGAGLLDYWVIKTDENGIEEWSQTYGGNGYDVAHSIQQTSDGDYIMVGYSNSYGAGAFDFYLIKINGGSQYPPQNIFVTEEGYATWETPTSVNPLGYNVYLDGVFVEFTTDLFYQYTDLTIGQSYTAGVSAIYDDGESNIIEFPFTYILDELYPPQNLLVAIDGYATWETPTSVNPLGYNVYLDGFFVEFTTDLFYQYTELTNGQSYLSGVSAVYDDGESNIIEFPFTYIIPGIYPPQNLFVTDEGYATWEEPISGPQTIQVDPLSVSYWTGSCTYTAWTDDSEIRGHDVEDGWMMFDISEIPAGATITEIEFHGFVNDNSWPYWQINGVYIDPLTASVGDLKADIQDDLYNYFQESGDLPIDWKVEILGGDANTDMEAALAQGWFCIGINSTDNSNTYYIEFDGWNETNPPYLVVTYEPAKSKTGYDIITSKIGNLDLLGYNVYLDGNFVDYTTDLFYQYEDLIEEQTYIAGVSAVYDEGESEIVEFEFTYIIPVLNPPQNLTYDIIDGNVVLDWDAPESKSPNFVKETKALLGYNAYHALDPGAFELLGYTTETTYTDIDPVMGLHHYYVTAIYDEGESTPTDTVDVLITGILNNILNSRIQLFPNPATDFVNIKSDFKIKTIKVYNYTGQIVANEQVNNKLYQVNTSQFNSGIYFFRIDTNEGALYKRIIIE